MSCSTKTRHRAIDLETGFVDWNLFALKLEHKFNNDADFSLQLFGLDAIENHRISLKPCFKS
jgi:hypothetical protein